MSTRLLSVLAVLASTALLAAALPACGDDDGTSTAANNGGDNNGKTDNVNNTGNNGDAQDASLCVAVRGNGPKIFAHFAGLARVHEHYGLIDGIAGGSSGSITSFLTESMYKNPHAFDCGGQPCDDGEAGLRIALMFKSISAYFEVLAGTDEALAIQQLAPVVAQAKAMGIDTFIANGDFEAARDALNTLFASEDLAELINPELLDLLANSPDPEFHVQEIWAMLSGFGTFAVDGDHIFIRPSVIGFDAFASKLGRIGTFYAAYGPADAEAWQQFFDACTPDSRGKGWPEIAARDAGDGTTCGELFRGMLGQWREAYLADEDNQPSRLDDAIGDVLPSLISTSVLEGDSVASFEQARTDWLAARPYTFTPSFDDIRFGYWGQDADLATVGANPNGYSDAKTSRFLPLGEGPWRVALSRSPAEPGLARALELNDTQVSFGGWSDLAPSLVLKNLGCDRVVLITRRGAVQGGFGPSVAGLLGMDAEEDEALYGLDNAASSIYRSLTEADAVLCTNWDGFESADFAGVFGDAYTSPLESSDPFFTEADDAYSNTTDRIGAPACTAGVE